MYDMFPVLIKGVKNKLLKGLRLVTKARPPAELYQRAKDCNVARGKDKIRFEVALCLHILSS